MRPQWFQQILCHFAGAFQQGSARPPTFSNCLNDRFPVNRGSKDTQFTSSDSSQKQDKSMAKRLRM